jgi:hypothetical protein
LISAAWVVGVIMAWTKTQARSKVQALRELSRTDVAFTRLR